MSCSYRQEFQTWLKNILLEHIKDLDDVMAGKIASYSTRYVYCSSSELIKIFCEEVCSLREKCEIKQRRSN